MEGGELGEVSRVLTLVRLGLKKGVVGRLAEESE